MRDEPSYQSAEFGCNDDARIDRPGLGEAAPPIAILFGTPGCDDAAASQIFVWSNGTWNRIYRGNFTRGSSRVDRGGKSRAYRLVSDEALPADLKFMGKKLILTQAGQIIMTWPDT